MSRRVGHRNGFAWLEVLLTLAIVSLVLQLWPSLARAAWQAIDLRRWSSLTWMLLNASVLFALVGVRYLPSLCAEWRERAHSPQQRQAQRQKEARQRKERREAIQLAKQARRRRLY